MSKKYASTYLPNSYHNISSDIVGLTNWYDFFLNTAIELAVNRFTWKNLPPEIDPRFLEFAITMGGSAVFFWDYFKGFCALRGAYSGLDIYGNPIDYHIVTPTGFCPIVHDDEGVIIWNNYTRTSDYGTIDLFARTLADLYQSGLVNVRGQKHPIAVVVGEESERLTLENAYAKLDGNHPVIYLKGVNNVMEKFQTINAQVPFVAPEIFGIARKMWEDLLKWLGIVIANTDKKERNVTGEVYTYNAVVYQLRNRGLQARQNSANKINSKFGLNLEVLFNESIPDFAQALQGMIFGEVEE